MRDYLKIIRPYNLGFIAILMWRLAEGLVWYQSLLLIAAAVLIAAGGFVINDYFDVKIDRINHPESVIVTNSISKKAALRYGLSLMAAGIVSGLAIAWMISSRSLAMMYIFIPGLLWFYSSSYKRMLLVGDFTLSFAVGSMPFPIAFVHMAQSITSPLIGLYMWISLALFLLTWIIGLVESIMDIEGEREMECHTIPVVWGETAAKVIIGILGALLIATIVAIIYAYF